MNISLSTENAGIKDAWLKDKKFLKNLRVAHDNIHGIDRSIGTGWVELPNLTTETEIEKITSLAEKVREMCDVFVVIGIGGSFAGTKAALEMLEIKSSPEIVFVGTTLSAREINSCLDSIKDKRVCVCAISKSGATTETLLAFSFLESFMKKKYKKNKEYRERIFVITDYEKGYLRELCTTEKYELLIIPRTVGGRYSVLSPVGLFPLAVGGVDIEKLVGGAKNAYKDYFVMDLEENYAYKYAAARNMIHTKGKKAIEVFATFDDRLPAFFEWLKQLFAESEGKDGKGLFVSSLTYSTDLHSFGQFIQEGNPILFETFLNIEKPSADARIEKLAENSPIAVMGEKLISEVVSASKNGVILAHKSAKVPIIEINISELNETSLGELFYFFEMAAAVSSYLLGVNPFNQPGVEKYKEETRKALNENK